MKTFYQAVFVIFATAFLACCATTQTPPEHLSGCWEETNNDEFEFDPIQFDKNTFSYHEKNGNYRGLGRYDVLGNLVRLEIDYDPHPYQFSLSKRSLTLTHPEHNKVITLKPCKTEIPYQSVVINDEGQSVDIPHLTVDIEIDGTTVITSVTHDITTTENWNTEALVYFPLPDNARILEYAIDIKGRLVPGVAIKKDDARYAFETIQSAGIDPGIAEIRQGNVFSTEIYPLSNDTPRKVRVKYIETLEIDKHGQYRYQFPFSKYLNTTELTLNIRSHNIDKKSKLISRPSKYLNQVNPYVWHGLHDPEKNKRIARFKDLEMAIRPLREEHVSLYKNHENKLYASLQHTLSAKDLDDIRLESLNILWDASVSMASMHEQNIQVVRSLLKYLSKRGKNIDIPITVFASDIHKHEVFNSSDSDAIISFLNSSQYDGGTRYSAIGNLESDAALLFSDGINSLSSHVLLKSDNPIYILSHSESKNLPYLSEVARHTNGFIFDLHKTSPKHIPSFIGKKAPSIQVSAHTVNKHYFYRQTVLNNHLINNIDIQIQPNNENTVIPKVYVNQNVVFPPENLAPENSILGQQKFIDSKLFFLLSNPQKNREEITDFGLSTNTATPYTTLIVFEDIDDYLAYEVTPPHSHPDIAGYYENLERHKADLAKEESERKQEFWQNIREIWHKRISWWKGDSLQKHQNTFPQLEEIIVTAQKRSAGPPPPKIQIEPKQNDSSYILKAKETIGDDANTAYQAYLDLKNINQNSPAYYVEWARLFYQHGNKVIARRILSNLVEMDNENVYFKRVIAYLMREFDDELFAIAILENARDLRPYQPNSYRDLANTWEALGNKEANKQHIAQALKNYEYTAFDDWRGTGWGDEEIRLVAIEELLHLHHQHPELNVNFPELSQKLIKNMDKDVRVVISWNSRMADIDLHIQEPSGDEVSYRRRYGNSGGYLTYDDTDGFGPEEYLNRKAQKGEYKIYANLYASNAIEMFGPISVTMDIYLNYGRKDEIHKTTTIQLEDRENNERTQKIYIGKFEI